MLKVYMIKSLRLAWLKRIFSTNRSPGTNAGTWKNYLRYLLKEPGGLSLFSCNCGVKDLSINSPRVTVPCMRTKQRSKMGKTFDCSTCFIFKFVPDTRRFLMRASRGHGQSTDEFEIKTRTQSHVFPHPPAPNRKKYNGPSLTCLV